MRQQRIFMAFMTASVATVWANKTCAYEFTRSSDLSFAGSKLNVPPSVKLNHDLWDPGVPMVFIHPPKTAGTNLANLMSAIESVNPKVAVKRAAVPRVPGRSPNLFTEGSIGGLARVKNNPEEFNGSNRHLDFISGHMPVPEVQNESALFGSKVYYIGMMRTPVAREISAANFDFQRGYVEQADIVSYLLNMAIDNLQTRLYAGENAMTSKCTAETLEKAKKNIKERFTFVAPINDIDLVMAIVASRFGVTDMAYAQAQVSGFPAITLEDEDKFGCKLRDLRYKLFEKHEYDNELYNWVKVEWEVWKIKHIESITGNVDPKKQYLTLMPDFAQTKQPETMNALQIAEHNHSIHLDMVPVYQRHSGLSVSDKASTSLSR